MDFFCLFLLYALAVNRPLVVTYNRSQIWYEKWYDLWGHGIGQPLGTHGENMPLTARQIEQAKPKEKSHKLTDGAGFYLYIAPMGLKSWRKNYTRAGKQKTATHRAMASATLE